MLTLDCHRHDVNTPTFTDTILTPDSHRHYVNTQQSTTLCLHTDIHRHDVNTRQSPTLCQQPTVTDTSSSPNIHRHDVYTRQSLTLCLHVTVIDFSAFDLYTARQCTKLVWNFKLVLKRKMLYAKPVILRSSSFVQPVVKG